jgi:hypothetical protein
MAAADPLGAARPPARRDARSRSGGGRGAVRRRLGAGLARVRRDAVDELSGFTAAVAPDRHEVAAAAPEIAALERRLRDGVRVEAAGMAMLRLLLTDGSSPLYDPVGAGSLARHLRAVAGALGAPVR